MKWTNYIKGYQKRWFVLSNGLLSYYRTQEEMAHTCRGTINLAGAAIDAIDATHFVITNGPSQVFHLRALNEVQRQRWVTALELAKAKAIKNLEDVSDEEKDNDNETPVTALKEKLSELITTHNLVQQKHHELMKVLADVETGKEETGTNLTKLKEKAVMFRVTANAMAKVAGDYFTLAQTTEDHRRRSLMHERALNIQLQENFESLAKQMHGLETQARMVSQKGLNMEERGLEGSEHLSSSSMSSGISSISQEKPPLVSSDITVTPGTAQRIKDTTIKKEVSFNLPSPESSQSGDTPHIIVTNEIDRSSLSGDEDDEDEQFYDAMEASDIPEEHQMGTSKQLSHKRTESTVSVNESQLGTPIPESVSMENLPATIPNSRMMTFTHAVPGLMDNVSPTIKNRRTSVTPRPNVRLSLWGFVKNCIGKDLSKIPLPVHFGEPLSFLQRIAEDITYYKLLDEAAACTNTIDEITHVAAFAVSAYESPAIRVYKPFNPLLGETFELDRRAECGFRLLFEQVSHHPPMLAMHAEHKEWTFWQEFTLASKFRGKYIQCFPIGCMHLVFHRSGSHYTWNKLVVTIHNIIVGKLWVDNSGDMNVVNHTTGEKCELKFQSYSYFTRERQRKVTGQCLDKYGIPQMIVRGYWDEYIEYAPIISTEGKDVLTGSFKELWRVGQRPPGAEKMYYFSEFTASLNEIEDGIAPTDSRLRPDQHVMEGGDFDEANRLKALLEEKQRERRRKREAIQIQAAEAASLGNHEEAKRLEKEAAYTPTWFHKEFDPYSNTMLYVYNGGYWECKEKREWMKLSLTDIFET